MSWYEKTELNKNISPIWTKKRGSDKRGHLYSRIERLSRELKKKISWNITL